MGVFYKTKFKLNTSNTIDKRLINERNAVNTDFGVYSQNLGGKGTLYTSANTKIEV
jgi:hypothetical protein